MTDELWELPPTARSVVEARRHVVRALDSWGLGELSEAAALLTSELVTNAVLHARTPVMLSVARNGTAVRVDVTDGSPVPPSMRRGSPTSTTGRGMQLLTKLADAWSAETAPGGKTVWFTLSTGRDPWRGYHAHDWLAEADL